MYERVRKFRATKVQQASERAAEDMDERIGFTPLTPHEMALAAAKGKLTGKSRCHHTAGRMFIPF